MHYWFLLHYAEEFILFMFHFQIPVKFILSVNDDGGANSCSDSHIFTLLGP